MSPDLASIAEALDRALPGQVERDVAFGSLTTWRVGGSAAIRVRVDRDTDVAVVAEVLGDSGPNTVSGRVPVAVVGRGSNLLVADAGFPGVVITLGPAYEGVDLGDRVGARGGAAHSGAGGAPHVGAGAATALPVLARQCAAAGRAGLGFYVGIPGSVGGAVRMNAGGHGRETVEVLRTATVADLRAGGSIRVRDAASLGLGYRCSALGPTEVVLRAEFAVEPGDPEALRDELGEIVRWRTEHQPGGANAGSVFRNPPGDAAARLIDQICGLSGRRIGGATVSEKHANFIQAEVGATAADVHQLIATVRDRVAAETGVELEVEVHFLGFEPA